MTRKNGAKDNAKPTGEGFLGDPNRGGENLERPNFAGFVNPQFTESDKATFDAWLEDGENYFTSFAEAIHNNWQFTVKKDTKNNCVVCTASCWDGRNQNAGWMLPLRAPDPARALAKAVWALTHFYGYQIHNRGNGLRDGELW